MYLKYLPGQPDGPGGRQAPQEMAEISLTSYGRVLGRFRDGHGLGLLGSNGLPQRIHRCCCSSFC